MGEPKRDQSEASLQAAQEVQDILLGRRAEVIEARNDPVRLRRCEIGRAVTAAPIGGDIGRDSRIVVPHTPATGVELNGLQQIIRASIVEEVNALPDSPQRRSPELIRSGSPLDDIVSQRRSHVVKRQIRIQIHRLVGQSSNGRVSSSSATAYGTSSIQLS